MLLLLALVQIAVLGGLLVLAEEHLPELGLGVFEHCEIDDFRMTS
jgi:hypothetical protein